MTVRAPSWLQNGTYPAQNDDLLLEALLGGSINVNPPAGVVAVGDYLVTAAATPNMSVTSAAGAAFINGTENADQGAYGVINDGAVVVPIAASSASNPRISILALQVLDDFYSGASHIGQLIEVAGTPASTPVAPTLPKNCIGLASVTVRTSTTSILSSDITDIRAFYPSNPSLAALIATLNTEVATLNSEVAALAVTGWTAATLAGSWTNYGSGYVPARFKKVGTMVFVQGTTTGGTGTLFTLPVGYRPATNLNVVSSGNGAFATILIASTGVVSLSTGTSALSFDFFFDTV